VAVPGKPPTSLSNADARGVPLGGAMQIESRCEDIEMLNEDLQQSSATSHPIKRMQHDIIANI